MMLIQVDLDQIFYTHTQIVSSDLVSLSIIVYEMTLRHSPFMTTFADKPILWLHNAICIL
jgi:hypothetical protein